MRQLPRSTSNLIDFKNFLDSVAKRKPTCCIQLFGRLQTEIGMPAKAHPTAYGFRHTFIDELKQAGVEEPMVARLVGHMYRNMTLGRYGKKYPTHIIASVVQKTRYPVLVT